jgi:hypothetical protein
LFGIFKRKARIAAERRERALNIEQKRASQALLNGRVEKLLESQRRAKNAGEAPRAQTSAPAGKPA